MEKEDKTKDCYGKFMSNISTQNCDTCEYRTECYKLWDSKTKNAELQVSLSCDIPGYCATCG